MHVHTHYERETRGPLRPGSRAHLRALEALWVFYALSCYLSLSLKHSDTKWDINNIVDQSLGEGCTPVAPPPLNSPLLTFRAELTPDL